MILLGNRKVDKRGYCAQKWKPQKNAYTKC